MKKEKTVRTYQRRTKSGKTVTVHQHTASYEAANAAAAVAGKKGAGEEIAAKKAKRETAPANSELGFSEKDFKEWYHWDTENDPKNEAALRVEKALKKSMGAKGYRKFYDECTDGYSARGHNKAFKGLQAPKSNAAKTPKGANVTRDSLLGEGYTEVKASYREGGISGYIFDPVTRTTKKAKVVRGKYLVSPDGKKVYRVTSDGVTLDNTRGAWAAEREFAKLGGSKAKTAKPAKESREAPKSNEASAIRRYAKDEDIPLKSAYEEWKTMSSMEKAQIKREQAAWDSKQQKQKERRMRVSGNGKSVKGGLSKGKVFYGDEAVNAKRTLLGEGYKQKKVTYEITRNLPVYGKKTWKTTVTALVSPDGKKAYKYEGSGNMASLTGSDKEFNTAWSRQSK